MLLLTLALIAPSFDKPFIHLFINRERDRTGVLGTSIEMAGYVSLLWAQSSPVGIILAIIFEGWSFLKRELEGRYNTSSAERLYLSIPALLASVVTTDDRPKPKDMKVSIRTIGRSLSREETDCSLIERSELTGDYGTIATVS